MALEIFQSNPEKGLPLGRELGQAVIHVYQAGAALELRGILSRQDAIDSIWQIADAVDRGERGVTIDTDTAPPDTQPREDADAASANTARRAAGIEAVINVLIAYDGRATIEMHNCTRDDAVLAMRAIVAAHDSGDLPAGEFVAAERTGLAVES